MCDYYYFLCVFPYIFNVDFIYFHYNQIQIQIFLSPKSEHFTSFTNLGNTASTNQTDETLEKQNRTWVQRQKTTTVKQEIQGTHNETQMHTETWLGKKHRAKTDKQDTDETKTWTGPNTN